MNKKQLTLQNSSLFAELERKSKEIEILSIRLEESETNSLSLKGENDTLKSKISALSTEIMNLKNQIELITNDYNRQTDALKAELEAAKAEIAATVAAKSEADPLTYNIDTAAVDEPAIPEENSDEYPIKAAADNEDDETPLLEVAEESALPTEPETEIKEVQTEEQIIKNREYLSLTPEADQKSTLPDCTPMNDLLRDYGAKIIGKITRVTAEVISKISTTDADAASSLKTLALGKNESFKFRIMELAKERSDFEKIMEEMDFLAEETIVYLKSI